MMLFSHGLSLILMHWPIKYETFKGTSYYHRTRWKQDLLACTSLIKCTRVDIYSNNNNNNNSNNNNKINMYNKQYDTVPYYQFMLRFPRYW